MEIKNIKENKELKDKIIEIIDQDIRKNGLKSKYVDLVLKEAIESINKKDK